MQQRTDHRETDTHVLADRLNTGWMLIEAEINPNRRAHLEDHRLRLLREYEAACGGAPGNRRETEPVFSDPLKEGEQ